jgi:methionine synthase I (cobalamin-dependent)
MPWCGRGVEIARAAGNCALPVLAAFGPLRGEAVGGYAGLAEVAMLAGAEGVVLETMTDAEDARAGVAVMVGAGVPVAVTFTAVVDAQGAVRTLCGKPLGDAARRVEDAGAMAVGVNCCDGPATVLAGVTELRGVVGVPIIARPNAGVERTMGAEEFGAWGARLFAAGAAVVGGCCGTTPGHIAALAGGMLRPRA